MMRIQSGLFAALALLIWGQAASAQTADDIVERYLQALGGRAALGKVTSRASTGTITLSTPGGDVTGPMEAINAQPNKARVLIKLDLTQFNLGQMTIDQRFDGTAGYVIDTLQGNRDVTGDQLEAMRNASFPTPLLNYREAGIAVELAGKEKVDDHEAFVLVLTPKTGPPARLYVDVSSNLMLRQVVKANVPAVGDVEQTTEFLTYREVDGLQVPVKIRTTSPVQTSTVYLTDVRHNVPVEAALFSKPAGN